MATVFEEFSTEEQRSFCAFFWAKRVTAKDNSKKIFSVYDGKGL
jgi:hypothetical protein